MNINWGKLYIDHYPEFFGVEAIERQVFTQNNDLRSIQVLTFDHVVEGCRTFCSLGLSLFADEVGQVAEVCCPVDDRWEDVPHLISNALFFLVQASMTVGRGVSIRGLSNINRDFSRKYNKSALYLTVPYDFSKDFFTVSCGESIGHVYLAAFITQEEDQFFRQHGAEVFEDKLVEKEVDLYSLSRPSCV